MGKFELPGDHKPGMAVPRGGSSCASCEYYQGNMTCGNQYFRQWHGSNVIPAKSPDEYCSDWWEPAKKAKPTSAIIRSKASA